jgi:hypothetical protein
MQFQYQQNYCGWMVFVTPPECIGVGSDDNLIEGYLIDEELIAMVVGCIQSTSVTIMHPTGGKR